MREYSGSVSAPKVSIVVTNFKQKSDLELSLNALLQTTYPNIELIVVDCCTPKFREWMKERYPTLKSIHFCEDIGTAAQRNAGFQQTDRNSDYVCFIDDDVIVVPEWLDNIIKLMENNKDIGAAQPVRFNYTRRSESDGLGYLMTHTGFPYRIETTEENLLKLKSKKIMDIFYGETTIMVVRYGILFRLDSDLKPFDNDHLYAWDDVDLGWRIWLMGYRVVITSESFCYHKRDKNNRVMKLYDSRYIYLVTRGRFISMIKNYEISSLFKYLPVAVIIELVKSAFLLYYRPDHAAATIKGIIWGLTHFRYMKKKRSISRRPLIKKNNDLNRIFIKTSALDLLKQFMHNWR
jgi:GT2 family glycosyltransferase